ncbi:MAG: DUF1249 domain-containing protein [Candidatus Thiodiazotropha endolucinida]|uniref:DUF1249 domain-containing protein n=2 Tax=Candidatus Thiodiazotropha TaxID=1913444 RepID=A0A9E4NY57_9GAMM|nr:DUF1249 domain-containing protein [Candidatus Thiodiazotropha endolucinida]MCG7877754.1 DUF1249 domain-containing protein [Candidatus Thiodiazotropha taylori]MCG7861507.1 DUF1249 domain-containing protein [Candidatus Thiodiazotropha endolucinida]MCG7880709.1 DUF1249 domain-containing protein [Candidatus Thiodiazotropha taylori]MCG7887346.1 DUF1249 domain-containing protein [Candidatus Thiodiazotropha taylori]MCG7890458.1 DUF1249 domain-containing protein [Candidatus Thiodiazotropha taylori]
MLAKRPSVGMVLDLSEENYALLMRLAPCLAEMSGQYQSNLEHGMDLYLEVMEQTPYTSLVHLTYYFSHAVGDYPDPDATLRVYHDSSQIDVLDLRQSSLPLHRWGDNPTLEQRWRINLFLTKWLQYCVAQGHGFIIKNHIVTNGYLQPEYT